MRMTRLGGILAGMRYTITLEDFPEIPQDVRVKAEDQYRRALEKALGGPDDVLPAYRAWLGVSESGNDQLDKAEVVLATQWQKACDLARQAGFRTLGESAEAYFEFKPSR
ncbi:hypothetical protein [Polaromonas hydrogenivorans]|uniref:Uncharacterized protein n=1 Tax=Polaromonas hydrogenivorans TaxID=335476 RepID=A0AAU7M200_9BURK